MTWYAWTALILGWVVAIVAAIAWNHGAHARKTAPPGRKASAVTAEHQREDSEPATPAPGSTAERLADLEVAQRKLERMLTDLDESTNARFLRLTKRHQRDKAAEAAETDELEAEERGQIAFPFTPRTNGGSTSRRHLVPRGLTRRG